MSEEDWFERALRELDTESQSDAEPDTEAENDDTDEEDDEERAGRTDEESGSVDAEAEAERSEPPEPDPFGGVRTDDDDPFGGPADADERDDPFGGPASADGRNDPFGGSRSTPAGTPDFERGGDSSDPDAFRPEAAGGNTDEFGFRDFNGGTGDSTDGPGTEIADGPTETFDDEDFESNIDRIKIGIEGLDEMVQGGIPERSLMVVIGTAGTGKTTFALQFLREGLENGEKGVYITLEESREAILSTAEEKGWPFRTYADDGQLAIVSLDPIEMANSLASLRNDISRLIEDFGANRLVLDSVSLLEMMYDHPSKRRSEVFDFTRSLKEAGVTTMLTSEASEDNQYASRYGIVEYLTDAVFVLQYVRPSDFRETRLAVEIQKIRDANHSRETKPYEITNEGISVYRRANIF